MCGRTRLAVPPSDLADTFDVDATSVATIDETSVVNLNCAPTDTVLVVRRKSRDSHGDARELVAMRWGLVPFYVRDIRDSKPLINARVETVATSRAFRDSYRKRRCLVVADGFYEWRHEGKKKLPHLVQRADGKPFGMAAIWDRWRPHGGASHGGPIETCAVITRDPTAAIAAVHDRMPLALEMPDYAAWLNPDADEPSLQDILQRAVTDWTVTPIELPDPPSKKQLRLF